MATFERCRLAELRFVLVRSAALLSLCCTSFAHGAGPGGVSGFNLVRIEGVVSVKQMPAELMKLKLVIGDQQLPISVLAVRRLSGGGEGRAVLRGLGEIEPELRLLGTQALIDRIEQSRGSRVILIGNLTVGSRSMLLVSVELADPGLS